MELTHASVYMIKGDITEIVLISDLEDFYPKGPENFDRTKKYKYWFEEEKFVKVYILRLGTSAEDIMKQNEAKRLRIPNKRQESFFSSDTEEDSVPTKRKVIVMRQLFPDENELREKEMILMTSRKRLIDSDKDYNSCGYNEKMLDVEQSVQSNGTVEEEDLLDEINQSRESTKSDDTTILNPDDGRRKVARFTLSRIHDDQSAKNLGTVSPHPGSQPTSAASLSGNSLSHQSTLALTPGASQLSQGSALYRSAVSTSPDRVSVPAGSMNSRINNSVAPTGENTLNNTGRRNVGSQRQHNGDSSRSPVRQEHIAVPLRSMNSRIDNYVAPTGSGNTSRRDVGSQRQQNDDNSRSPVRREPMSVPLRSLNSRIDNSVAPTGGNTGKRDVGSQRQQNDDNSRSPVRREPISVPLRSMNSRIDNHVAPTGSGNTGRRYVGSQGRQNDDNSRSPGCLEPETNQRDPQQLYVSVNEQVYIGAGKYIYEDMWALMLMKSDGRFVREMLSEMWEKAVLRKRCLRKKDTVDSENDENNEAGDGIKVLTPVKYKLVEGALRYKLKKNLGDRASPTKVAVRMKRMWRYTSEKLYYVKEKRKRNRLMS